MMFIYTVYSVEDLNVIIYILIVGWDIILLIIAIFALYYLLTGTLETQSVSNLGGKSFALPRTSCDQKIKEGFNCCNEWCCALVGNWCTASGCRCC